MSSYYRQQLEAWLKVLDVKADSVLDVGGSQLPVKDRVRSWDVRNYKILDLEKPHKGNKPDYIGDLNDEDMHAISIGNKKFDIIFCLEVAEYIWNPVAMLWNIMRLIKNEGILYISFPFVYGVHPPNGKDYLRYTPDGAEKLLKESGFEIIDHIHRKGNNLLTKFYGADKMRIRKDYDQNITGSLIKAKKM